jgi:hypothetical protein
MGRILDTPFTAVKGALRQHHGYQRGGLSPSRRSRIALRAEFATDGVMELGAAAWPVRSDAAAEVALLTPASRSSR